jgi:hypothetical protein
MCLDFPGRCREGSAGSLVGLVREGGDLQSLTEGDKLPRTGHHADGAGGYAPPLRGDPGSLSFPV